MRTTDRLCFMQEQSTIYPQKTIDADKSLWKGCKHGEKMERKDEASTSNATEGALTSGACRSSAGSRGTGPRTPTRSPGLKNMSAGVGTSGTWTTWVVLRGGTHAPPDRRRPGTAGRWSRSSRRPRAWTSTSTRVRITDRCGPQAGRATSKDRGRGGGLSVPAHQRPGIALWQGLQLPQGSDPNHPAHPRHARLEGRGRGATEFVREWQ